jgi:hypothetical protein
MIEGTALILISTMPIDQDIPAEGIFRMFYSIPHQHRCYDVYFSIHDIPRPFGLGEPAGFRVSG